MHNPKWFYREAGNRTCDPWFTRHRFFPYTTAASLTLGARGWPLIYICFLITVYSDIMFTSWTCNYFKASPIQNSFN